MSSAACFGIAGIGLFLLGFRALVLRRHLLHRILAVNLMGSGAFLLLVAPARTGDPLPQAMVITGIVVAVSATAFALNLMLKVHQAAGEATLQRHPDD